MTDSNVATLHIISKSPSHKLLYQNALDSMLDGDAILFTESGVYALCSKDFAAINNTSNRIYALSLDVAARGLTEQVDNQYTFITDEQFVELCCQYQKTISWF